MVAVASDAIVVVRPPRIAIAVMLVWFLILESFGIAALAAGHYRGGFFLVIIWWPFLIPFLFAMRDQVRIEGDWLIARGWFRERRWTRSDIRRISVARSRWAENF